MGVYMLYGYRLYQLEEIARLLETGTKKRYYRDKLISGEFFDSKNTYPTQPQIIHQQPVVVRFHIADDRI